MRAFSNTIFNPLSPPPSAEGLGGFGVGGYPQTPSIRLWRTLCAPPISKQSQATDSCTNSHAIAACVTKR